MANPLHLRRLLLSDLDFADSLRELAGWNQTLGDWRRFLAMQPAGCFLAQWEGAPAGAATTLSYGTDLAWIGMVLVHPEYRRRGIARALILQCIEYLRNSGVRCIKLDATPEGQFVYKNLGFKEEWTWRRWETSLPPAAQWCPPSSVRPWKEGDAGAVEAQDARAFGASRRGLLTVLAQESCCALAFESNEGALGGYGMARQGAKALYFGPVAANSPLAGLALITALVAQGKGRVFWDIPDLNTVAMEWAGRHGFRPQRSLTRMWLGENGKPGNPLEQFALAGPELG
ncbi:MAG: GNAT family N-acetyltransferase [Limisphaerales bacterium]